jgi:hypothetical protein
VQEKIRKRTKRQEKSTNKKTKRNKKLLGVL